MNTMEILPSDDSTEDAVLVYGVAILRAENAWWCLEAVLAHDGKDPRLA